MCVVAPSRLALKRVEETWVREVREELRRALGLGGLHRADDRGDRRRPRRTLEQGERVREQDAARARRRVGQHRLAAVGDADRLTLDGRVGGEVGAREHPAALGHPVAHRRGDVAGVERRRPFGGEPLERVGQRGVPEHVADQRRAPLGHEQRARLRRGGGDRREDLEQVRLALVDLDAVAGGGRGRRDQLRRWQPGEALCRGPRARRRAVGARRTGADVEHLDRVAEVDVDGQQRRVRRAGLEAASRRLDEEVQQHRRRAGRRDEHVAAGAEPGEHRLGDERREHGGQRGVDRVAARAQDLRARARCYGMARGDDAAHRVALRTSA